MPVVERSILIRCTPEQAFDLSQDYALRLRWDPFLAELRFLDGASVGGVGVRTWVKSKRGIEMVSEYVAWDRPRVVAIKMVEDGKAGGRATRMFEQFGGSWRFRAVERGADGTDAADAAGERAARTLVTMRYTFATRPRWLRWVMGPVARWVFGRDVRGRLAGLKRGVEEMGLVERLSVQ